MKADNDISVKEDRVNGPVAFRRAAAIIAAPVALASWVLVLMAANFNPDSVQIPSL